MDAISRIIYWMGNEARGVNGNAVDFVRNMNAGLHKRHPSAMLIAEDSTAFQGCTHPASEGGLDFDYKWDLGWMNDTLDYMKKQSDERVQCPEKLTFSMMYFYNERHMLPFSHDEVVHGKKTIVDKIFGSYEEKFAQLRSLYMYMVVHPGKTLNFMGNEIAMFREWDETKEPDYFLLGYPMHDAFSKYYAELMKLAKEEPSLYEKDYDPKGFHWVCMNDQKHNVYGIERLSDEGATVTFFNFSNKPQVYHYTPAKDHSLVPVLHSDWQRCTKACGPRPDTAWTSICRHSGPRCSGRRKLAHCQIRTAVRDIALPFAAAWDFGCGCTVVQKKRSSSELLWFSGASFFRDSFTAGPSRP